MNILTNQSIPASSHLNTTQEKVHIEKLFTLSPDPLCVLGYDGYFKIANPALLKLLGYTKEELFSQPAIFFVHPEDVRLTRLKTKTGSDSSDIHRNFENRYRKKKGAYIKLQWSIAVNPDDEFIYCSVKDSTELLKNNREITSALENFNLVIKGSNAGLWSHNLLTGEEWWSDRFYELLGYKPQDIKGSFDNFLALVHPSDLTYVQESLTAHLSEHKDYKIEIRLLCKDGNYKWVETSGQSLWNEQGDAIRMTGSVTDINDRKNAQLKINHHKFFLNQTAKMAKVGGWQLCFEKSSLTWSEEIYRIHEVPEGFVPELETAIDFYCEESKPIIAEAVENARKNGIGYDLELKIRTAKGRVIWIRAIGKPIYDSSYNIIGLQGAFQDIDEQKKRELSLNKSLEIISEQNNRLSNFAYIVSHNLRSHISNFQLLIELYDATQDPKELQKIMRMERTTFYRLQDTIEHLTEVVEIQTDISRQKVSVNLGTALAQTLDILAMDISRTGTQIVANFEQLPKIKYTKAYLESILLNLISNSIKYRHPDRVPKIEISSYLEQGRPVLKVQDNGLGIDLQANKDKIFGMFKTFHEHPHAKGIGLFLTKNQVESLGGHIEVESEVNAGTCFRLYLDRKRELLQEPALTLPK